MELNHVVQGECQHLLKELPDNSIDVVVTSPPYWGQRISKGIGIELDPRVYLTSLVDVFTVLLPKLKSTGIVWINLGDAYNTPVNWIAEGAYRYSTLGPNKKGLPANNSAYVKPRQKRQAFIDEVNWLSYGNLLALPYRLVIALCESGYLFRGEVIWKKSNPMPEGRCRRPHRTHESIFLFARNEKHLFRLKPPVKTVWEFGNEKVDDDTKHYSRFPEELPRRCIEAYGKTGKDVIVLDPFSGSGTTGLAAIELECSYIGFEIDDEQVDASNRRLNARMVNPRSKKKSTRGTLDGAFDGDVE